MAGARVFLLILCTLISLETWAHRDFPPKQKYKDWLEDIFAKKDFSGTIAEARQTIKDNIGMVHSKQGHLLDSLVVQELGECAMACGVFPHCHFVTIDKIKGQRSDKLVSGLQEDPKYNCTMYTEDGHGKNVSGTCNQEYVDKIIESVDTDFKKETNFLDDLRKFWG